MFEWYNEVKTLNRGEAFGENAFQGNNVEKKKRETTIKAKEKSGLVVLSKENFFRLLNKVKIQ